MIDLIDELAEAAAAARPEHFDALVAAGVSSAYLRRGPARFGIAEIDVDGDGYYQPAPTGEAAFIIPAVPLVAPWEDGFPVEDVADLVAWFPRDPRRWWRRSGMAPILNPDAIDPAAWYRAPLDVRSTPLAWLRASGRGIVLLDPEANLRLWLGDVRTVHADDIDLGEQLERRMREPSWRAPRVLVAAPSLTRAA